MSTVLKPRTDGRAADQRKIAYSVLFRFANRPGNAIQPFDLANMVGDAEPAQLREILDRPTDRSRLKARDWIIVEKFCGAGWSMAEAVRAATLCHPSGVLFRVQEALDELVVACGGRSSKSA